jgi:hypothetical protein
MAGSISEDPKTASRREKMMEHVAYVRYLLENDQEGYRRLANQTRTGLKREGDTAEEHTDSI